MKPYIFIAFLLALAFPYTASAAFPAVDVTLSSTKLQQADTLLVVVKNEPAAISGRVGFVPMRFFRDTSGKDWIAMVGMPHNKFPGTYKVSITFPGRAVFQKNITVAKRKYPITKLTITPELAQKGYTAKKIVQTVENEENVSINKVMRIIQPASFITKPFIYPLSETVITGNYGSIRAAKNYQIQHLGVDLKAAVGTPVHAVNDGNVVFVRSLPDYGNTVIVDHGLGVYSLYLHLNSFNVEEAQYVKQWQVIGFSGQTGYAIGPHLHFSIKLRGSSVDPLKFIEASRALAW